MLMGRNVFLPCTCSLQQVFQWLRVKSDHFLEKLGLLCYVVSSAVSLQLAEGRGSHTRAELSALETEHVQEETFFPAADIVLF